VNPSSEIHAAIWVAHARMKRAVRLAETWRNGQKRIEEAEAAAASPSSTVWPELVEPMRHMQERRMLEILAARREAEERFVDALGWLLAWLAP